MIIETNNKKFELGKKGCIRWIEPINAFHIEQMSNGNIRVYVPSSCGPKNVECGAREIRPPCPTCGKEQDKEPSFYPGSLAEQVQHGKGRL